LGRDFILVNHSALSSSERKFNFFHMPSLSAVEVKVMEPTPFANSPASPDTEVLPEVCLSTHAEDGLLVGMPVSPSCPVMDVE